MRFPLLCADSAAFRRRLSHLRTSSSRVNPASALRRLGLLHFNDPGSTRCRAGQDRLALLPTGNLRQLLPDRASRDAFVIPEMSVPTKLASGHGSWCSSEYGYHPTQKPIALLKYPIKTYTDPGMTVLDHTGFRQQARLLPAALDCYPAGIHVRPWAGKPISD